jgi:hypothetical protein
MFCEACQALPGLSAGLASVMLPVANQQASLCTSGAIVCINRLANEINARSHTSRTGVALARPVSFGALVRGRFFSAYAH